MSAGRVLVTGATGFLGQHLVAALRREGPWSDIRALARPSSPKQTLAEYDLEWFDGDLCDAASLKAAVEGCEAVFHTAALYALWSREPARFYQANVRGTEVLLAAAQAAGVRRFVYTSSVACVAQAPAGGLSDESRFPPIDELCGDYKVSKFRAEERALAAAEAGKAEGFEVVIVNPASIIGPGDLKPTPTGKIILDFLNGKMPAYVDTGLNFVDVRDVAAAHWLAYLRGEPGQRYILGNRDNNLSLKDFLGRLAALTGLKAPTVKIPYPIAWLAGAVSTGAAALTRREPGIPLNGVRMSKHRMFFDPSRAIDELGMPQTPLEKTIRDAARWFEEAGRVTRPLSLVDEPA